MSDQLEDILAECFLRLESEGSSAVDEICSRHPELAPEIREQISSAQGLGLVQAGEAPEFPDRLGEFRLIEPIGGGGMGVVYRAEQESLGREVAVKLIRPEHLYFPKTRARFQREAQAVARLNHPGIVPVHAVGTDGGIPWFAMELVVGVSLSEVVAALRGRDPATLEGSDLVDVLAASPRVADDRDAIKRASGGLLEGPWLDVVLRIGKQVAEALEHAHAHGVLHRDIKPSNLMLTPAGRVLILDFGLARDEATSPMTKTGQLLGSIPYMPPEQIEGEDVDARGDVYSLGVTLCELLTLSSPFEAHTTEETRRRILEGELAPIRATNERVTWEVETVCMVATSPDRRARYASAADLAQDLNRALHGEPITARRASWSRRARRWVSRNPAAALATALAVLLVVGGPLAFSIQQRKAVDDLTFERNAARAAESNALEQEQLALQARDDAREQARIAAERTRIAEEHWRFFNSIIINASTLTSGGHRITLGDLLAVLDRRAEEVFADSPVVASEIYSGLADAWRNCGDAKRSLDAAKNAVTWAEKCLDVNPGMLPQSLNTLGLSLIGGGRAKEAEPVLRRAVKVYEEEFGRTGVFANFLGNLALALNYTGRIDEAIEITREAIEVYESQETEDARIIFDLRYRLGNSLRRAKRFDEAEDQLAEQVDVARETFGELSAEHGRAISSLVLVYLESGRIKEGLPVSERTLSIYTRLVGRDHVHYAQVLRTHAILLMRGGWHDDAEESLDQVIAILEAHPAQRHQIVKARLDRAALMVRMDEPEEAARSYALAAADEETLSGGDGNAGNHHASAGKWLLAAGKKTEALEAFDRGVAMMLAANRPLHAGSIHERAARALLERGDDGEAAVRYVRAAENYAAAEDRERSVAAFNQAAKLQSMDDSIRSLERSLALSRKPEPLHERRAWAATALAQRLIRKDRSGEVEPLAREAVAAFVAAGEPDQSREALRLIAAAARESGKEDLARRCEEIEVP